MTELANTTATHQNHGLHGTLLIGLLCLTLAGSSACVGFHKRMGSDFLLEKGFKTDKWAPLVQIEDNQWLLFGFRISGGKPLNELLQTVSESNGCTALSLVEVRSQIRWPLLLVFNKQTTVYARCVGGKKAAKPKAKPKEEPAEEEAYEE